MLPVYSFEFVHIFLVHFSLMFTNVLLFLVLCLVSVSSLGVVTNDRVSGATPASFMAHCNDRNQYDSSFIFFNFDFIVLLFM
jgi:hypothetical protein